MSKTEYVKIEVVMQGAPVVNAAAIRERADKVVLIEVDMQSKYAECGGTGDSDGPILELLANEDTLAVDERSPRDAIAVIRFPEFKGWQVFSVNCHARYTFNVALVRG